MVRLKAIPKFFKGTESAHFNSKMVRLKEQQIDAASGLVIGFQFQNGAIKSSDTFEFDYTTTHFNSKMVRLKV